MIYIYTFFEVRIIGVPFVLLVGDEHQVWLVRWSSQSAINGCKHCQCFIVVCSLPEGNCFQLWGIVLNAVFHACYQFSGLSGVPVQSTPDHGGSYKQLRRNIILKSISLPSS